jgi:hypothetical protein
METIPREGNWLFRRLRSFDAFQAIQNTVRLHISTGKIIKYMWVKRCVMSKY